MRINKNIKKYVSRAAMAFVAAAALLCIALPSIAAVTASADTPICPPTASGNGNKCELPETQANNDTVQNVLRILFGVIGSFALLNITLSGFKYISSAGDPQKTSEAKNGIIFSLVGLMLAIAAEAIVAFVIHNIKTPL